MKEPDKTDGNQGLASPSEDTRGPVLVGTPDATHSVVLESAESQEPDESRATDTTTSETGDVAWIHYAIMAVSCLAALLTLPDLGPGALGVLGLASALPFVFYASLTTLLVGFVLAVAHHPTRPILGSYVVSLTILLHGLSPLVYEHLRFPWAWKHVGIVDFIQRTGSVDRHIESLSAYHNWPGFFGFNALASDLAGVDSALAYAAWAPVFFNLAYLLAMYVIFRHFKSDERLIATGLVIFTIGNWVGQDYFAPQAVAFLFYLMVIAILLQLFAAGRHDAKALSMSDSQRTLMVSVLILIFIALTITHQLTPIMTILMLAGLALIGRLRIKWLLIAAVAINVLWLASFARPFVDDYVPRVIADLSDIGGRVDDGLIDYSQVDTSQKYVSLAARGLTGLISLLAAIGFLRTFRKAGAWRLAAPLAGAPLAMAAASSYGDEIIFRAFLFALPMLSLFAAALWFTAPTSRLGRLRSISLAATLIAITFAGLVAMHGNDIHIVFTDDEVAAAETMYTTAQPGSGVIQLTTSYPTKFRNYEALEELSVASFSIEAKERFLSDPARWFAQWLKQGSYTEGYVFITRSQRAEIRRLGSLPSDSPEAIEESLRESSEFDLLVDTPDAVLFRLADEEPT